MYATAGGDWLTEQVSLRVGVGNDNDLGTNWWWLLATTTVIVPLTLFLPLLLILCHFYCSSYDGIGELSRSTTRHTVAMNSHCGRLNNCSHGWYNKNMKMLVMSGCTEEMFAMSRGKSECLPCTKQSIGIYSISSWSLDWCLPFILCLSADLMVSINGNVGNEKILICSCPCPFPW